MSVGLSFQNQNTKSTTKVVNNILQSTQNNCIISCGSTANNNTTIVIDHIGEITIEAQCTLDEGPSCVATNTLDSDISNILSSMASQDTYTLSGIAPQWGKMTIGVTNQNIDLKQYISNNISQISANTCQISAQTEANNNYTYIKGGSGNFTISSNAKVSKASCNLNNSAKQSVYNDATIAAEQKSVISTTGAIILIVIVIVIMIGAAVAISTSAISTGDQSKQSKKSGHSSSYSQQAYSYSQAYGQGYTQGYGYPQAQGYSSQQRYPQVYIPH